MPAALESSMPGSALKPARPDTREGGIGSQAPPSHTSWTPDQDLDFVSWLQVGNQLGKIGRSVGWWIGDWLRYGQHRYGEKYKHAARVSGYDKHSLANMAYVASRFAPERRRAHLSWSHHAALASLPEPEQEQLLDLAERNRLSVHDLHVEARAVKRAAITPAPASTKHRSGAVVVCPDCQAIIPIGAHATQAGA
jgi:hypothetical protein